MTYVKTYKEARKLTDNNPHLHIYPIRGKVNQYAVMTHLEWLNWK